MATPKRTCVVCYFFAEPYEYGGKCRRYPPQFYMQENDNQPPQMFFVQSGNPFVAPNHWCGEFKSAEES